jgi:hypothetical protein
MKNQISIFLFLVIGLSVASAESNKSTVTYDLTPAETESGKSEDGTQRAKYKAAKKRIKVNPEGIRINSSEKSNQRQNGDLGSSEGRTNKELKSHKLNPETIPSNKIEKPKNIKNGGEK